MQIIGQKQNKWSGKNNAYDRKIFIMLKRNVIRLL